MYLNNLDQYLFKGLFFLMILCPYSGQTQVYEEMIDLVDHPLSTIRIPSGHSAPYFFDSDRDGDMDMISGAANGQLYYYENIGSEEQAIFDSVSVGKLSDDKALQSIFEKGFGTFSKPSGIDHDDDGDLDLFCGTKDNGIYYFKCNGGVTGPVNIYQIMESTNKKNPLQIVHYKYTAPAFYDQVVNSSPMSCFGTQDGKEIIYLQYKDKSTHYFPISQSGRDIHNLTPTIGDIDSDGDPDLILGTKAGDIMYYTGIGYDGNFGFDFENTSSNPFSDIKVDSFSTPALVDIDGDGDLDLFVGQADGTFVHYKNVSIDDYLTVDNHHFIDMNANLACNGSAVIYGNLGIGAMPTADRLTVNGRVTAEDFNADVVDPPDYVFAKEYELRSLKYVQQHIDQYSHLPEIPSAAVMERDGVDLGDMSMMLLKKIEELTLYILEQEKRIITLEKLKSN